MNESTTALLAETTTNAREQLAAAWQLHIDRILGILSTRCPGDIEQIFEQRIAGLASQMEERLSHAVAEARASLRQELTEKLNQSARRLRSLSDEHDAQWANALVESTHGFCDRAVLFLLDGESLHLQAARNISNSSEFQPVPLTAAPAFANAVESRDTVVAMRTAGEMSQPVSSLIGEASDRKFSVFPVILRDRVLALLYADSNDDKVDSAALELLTNLAGASIVPPTVEVRTAEAPQLNGLVNIASAEKQPGVSSWFSLTREEQDLHLRAQRFARVAAAEMRLYKSGEVKKGRLAHDLYASLKQDMDSAREGFRRDFLSTSPTMVDYLHLELVYTLANGDAELLGSDYPGPMA